MAVRDRVVELRRVKARDLLPNPENWREHPRAQTDALREVLARVGYADVLLAFETPEGLMLYDGHARQELTPDDDVPVIVTDLSPDEARFVMTTLDPIGGLATSNKDALANLLATMQADGSPLDRLLRDLAQRNHIAWGDVRAVSDSVRNKDENAAAQREKWGTELGQVWTIPSVSLDGASHRLMCGDATDADAVRTLMAGERAELMATDPPYMVDYDGGDHPQSWSNKGVSERNKKWDEYTEAKEPLFVDFLRIALAEALAPKCAVYQWHATRRQMLTEQAWIDAGFFVHQSIVWVKDRAVLTRSHFMWQSEPCFYGWPVRGQPERRPPANESNVWHIDQQGEYDNIHPTQKPRELFARPMRWHLERGGLAYEPFSGSGTAIMAAEQTGRRCYAMELSPEYVAVNLQRFAEAGLEPRLVTADA